MSARTCLLCGKPLSRIWVGAGDDFCSREHRNQHRLRRGMDRLTEANKISSLMRRRENPRSIAVARLPRDFGASRRGFLGASVPAASGTHFSSLRPLSTSFVPRISSASERYLQPRPPRPAAPSRLRPPDSSFLRFSPVTIFDRYSLQWSRSPAPEAQCRPAKGSAGNAAPVAPQRGAMLPVRIPRARAAPLRDHALGAGGNHRAFSALRHAEIRAHFGSGAAAPPRIEPPSTAGFLKAQSPRRLKAPERTGHVQAISRVFGFRPPALRGALWARPLKARVALAALARQFVSTRNALNLTAIPRAIGRGISTRGLLRLPSPVPVKAIGIRWPGAVRIERRSPYNGHAPATREWGSLWDTSGLAGFPNPRTSLSASQCGRLTSRPLTIPLAPARADGAPRVALAPFAPPDSPFGYKEFQDQ
jgi:hypothetical protein